jgi:hypothetical protein
MELGRTNSGLRIGQLLLNNFAYADYLNLLAANVPDLQTLMTTLKYGDLCLVLPIRNVSHLVRLTFHRLPYGLSDKIVQNTNYIEILGANFRADLKSSMHVERLSAARRKAYSLLNAGLSYPGLAIEVKVHLWKTSVSPVCVMVHTACLSKPEILPSWNPFKTQTKSEFLDSLNVFTTQNYFWRWALNELVLHCIIVCLKWTLLPVILT